MKLTIAESLTWHDDFRETHLASHHSAGQDKVNLLFLNLQGDNMECYLCDSEAKWFTVNTDMQVKPVF
jgi:hypothetical protein